MRRLALVPWLWLASCGAAPVVAERAAPPSAPKAQALVPAPVELAAVTSKVHASHLTDLSGNLRSLLSVAMSNADWHGVTREQHLRATAAVEVMTSSSDGVDCVVEVALLDESGSLIALVRGRARVDGGADGPAEHDALEAAAEHAARSLPEAARKAKAK